MREREREEGEKGGTKGRREEDERGEEGRKRK